MVSNFKSTEVGQLTYAVVTVYGLYVLYVLGTFVFQITGFGADGTATRVGADYVNFWLGGDLALSGSAETIYNADQYVEAMTQRIGEQQNYYAFSYPPHSLPFLMPMGALPYNAGLILWSLFGFAVYGLAGRGFNLSRNQIGLMVLAPASVTCFLSGHTGLITGALLIGGMSQIEKRPVLAGILFGILTVKPQMGFLLVVALLAGGYWRTIFAAGLTFLGLVLTSLLMFGLDPWREFFAVTLPYQSQIVAHSIGAFDHMVLTPFKYMINLGGPIWSASLVQSLFAIAGIVVTFWAFRRPGQLLLKTALLCMATLMFSPYMAIYDMPILTFAILAYGSVRRDQLTVRTAVFLLSLAVLPIAGPIASAYHIPLTVCMFSVFIYMIIMELGAEPIRTAKPIVSQAV